MPTKAILKKTNSSNLRKNKFLMKRIFKRIVFLFIIWLVALTVHDAIYSLTKESPTSTTPMETMSKIASIEKQIWLLQNDSKIASFKIMQHRLELGAEYAKLFWSDDARISYLKQQIRYYETIPNQLKALEEQKRELSKAVPLLQDTPRPWYTPLQGLLVIMYSRLWDAAWYTLYSIGFLLLVKVFIYFVIAPLVGKRPAVSLSNEPDNSPVNGKEMNQTGEKSLSVCVRPAESITIIGEKYIQGHRVQTSALIRKRTQWLLDWTSPIMSLVCKLCFMTRFDNRPDSPAPLELNITSDDADEYFSCIDIEPGIQYFIKPSELIAFGSGIKISAKWKLFSLAAWCMGQVRFYALSGSGRVVVRSLGGISQGTVMPGIEVVERKHSLICASHGVKLHVNRNQTFWPFMTGEANLFDLKLIGQGSYLTSNVLSGKSSTSEKMAHAFLQALGQFAGF